MNDLAEKKRKSRLVDIEFAYYIKCFRHSRKHAKHIARGFKRGSHRFWMREAYAEAEEYIKFHYG